MNSKRNDTKNFKETWGLVFHCNLSQTISDFMAILRNINFHNYQVILFVAEKAEKKCYAQWLIVNQYP